ncbi:MAG: hypothetical protein ACRDSH_21120 [Pseudonocardiaceae bacterium]
MDLGRPQAMYAIKNSHTGPVHDDGRQLTFVLVSTWTCSFFLTEQSWRVGEYQ